MLLESWIHSFERVERTVCADIWEPSRYVVAARDIRLGSFFFDTWKVIKTLFSQSFIAGGFALFLCNVTKHYGDIDVFIPEITLETAAKLRKIRRFVTKQFTTKYDRMRGWPKFCHGFKYNNLFKDSVTTFMSLRLYVRPFFPEINFIIYERVGRPHFITDFPGKYVIESLRGFDIPLCKLAIKDMVVEYDCANESFIVDVLSCRASLARLHTLKTDLLSQLRYKKYVSRIKDVQTYQPCKLFVECYKICKDMHSLMIASPNQNVRNKLVLGDAKFLHFVKTEEQLV